LANHHNIKARLAKLELEVEEFATKAATLEAKVGAILLHSDREHSIAQRWIEIAPELGAHGGFMLSAAYGIAQAADAIYSTPSGWTGIVGSVMATIRPEGLKLGEAFPGMVSVIAADPPGKARWP
jgi:hypothetical protein